MCKHVCVSVWLCTHVSSGALGVQKRMSHSPGLLDVLGPLQEQDVLCS